MTSDFTLSFKKLMTVQGSDLFYYNFLGANGNHIRLLLNGRTKFSQFEKSEKVKYPGNHFFLSLASTPENQETLNLLKRMEAEMLADANNRKKLPENPVSTTISDLDGSKGLKIKIFTNDNRNIAHFGEADQFLKIYDEMPPGNVFQQQPSPKLRHISELKSHAGAVQVDIKVTGLNITTNRAGNSTVKLIIYANQIYRFNYLTSAEPIINGLPIVLSTNLPSDNCLTNDYTTLSNASKENLPSLTNVPSTTPVFGMV